MLTAWTHAVAASTPWFVLDVFPFTMDGGNASTLAWLGLFDGGSALVIGSDSMVGAAPQLTSWNTPAPQSTSWALQGAP